VVGDFLAAPNPDLLIVTILRHRRDWRAMWIGPGKSTRDFRAATLSAAVTTASAMATESYCPSHVGAAAELLILIFGRRVPVFDGPQLLVTGEPGQFTAKDVRDGLLFAGATLEDVLAAFGHLPLRQVAGRSQFRCTDRVFLLLLRRSVHAVLARGEPMAKAEANPDRCEAAQAQQPDP
jgi:hypothetical protein